jgi:uncharacterized membrane protein (DUF485 family)
MARLKHQKSGGNFATKFEVSYRYLHFWQAFHSRFLTQKSVMLVKNEPVFMLPISIGLLIFAVVLYSASIYLLDSLTMPKMFRNIDAEKNCNYGPDAETDKFSPPWIEPRDLWQIKDMMVFIWSKMTIPAVIVTFVSVIFMMFPIGGQPSPMDNSINIALILSVLSFTVAVIYVWEIQYRMEKMNKEKKYRTFYYKD